jgi:outer membrane protein assembly factor BamB
MPTDAAAGDQFGTSVALTKNIALIGAPLNDDAGSSTGSAYLFDTNTGQQLAKLTASDAAADDQFGASVAINGNSAIIGAWLDDDSGSASGSAYLFDITTGQELFKLTASDAAAGDRFGASVSLSDSVALIGARENDDAGSASGSAYLFDALTGQQLYKLTAADAAPLDNFGWSVALGKNKAIIGAPFDDDSGTAAGSAYVFDVSTGQQLFKLTAADPATGNQFGYSVAASGDIALVGANAGGLGTGAAYLFDLNTGLQLLKLTADDAALFDEFGAAVALGGNMALVGAHGDGDSGSSSGSAYLFDATTGQQLARLTASDAAMQDFFSTSVALSHNAALVGSALDDDAGDESGSAYLFQTIPEPATLSLAIIALLGTMANCRRTCKALHRQAE